MLPGKQVPLRNPVGQVESSDVGQREVVFACGGECFVGVQSGEEGENGGGGGEAQAVDDGEKNSCVGSEGEGENGHVRSHGGSGLRHGWWL